MPQTPNSQTIIIDETEYKKCSKCISSNKLKVLNKDNFIWLEQTNKWSDACINCTNIRTQKRKNKLIESGKAIKEINISKEELILAYSELKQIKLVAKKFGVSSGAISSRFVKFNIPYEHKIRYVCKDNFFDFDNEKSFYWAGFLAADGNVSKQNDISIGLCIQDFDHVCKFKKDIESDSPVTSFKVKPAFIDGVYVGQTEHCRFRIRSHYMGNSLRRFNIVPAKTYIYTIPDFVENSKYFRDYLRGYFDGDGWFSQVKNTGKISLGLCGTKDFIEKINKLIMMHVSVSSGSIWKQKNIFKLSFGKQHDVYLIAKFMYENSGVYLERKYKKSLLAKAADEATVIMNFDKVELENLYKTLKSAHKVAKILNCSNGVIYKYLHKYSIEIINKTKSNKRIEV
jgi:hypothetical protein